MCAGNTLCLQTGLTGRYLCLTTNLTQEKSQTEAVDRCSQPCWKYEIASDRFIQYFVMIYIPLTEQRSHATPTGNYLYTIISKVLCPCPVAAADIQNKGKLGENVLTAPKGLTLINPCGKVALQQTVKGCFFIS